LNSAQQQRDPNEEIVAMGWLVQDLIESDSIFHVEEYLPRMLEIIENVNTFDSSVVNIYLSLFKYYHAIGHLDSLERTLKDYIQHEEGITPYARLFGAHWMGMCRVQQGRIEEASQMFATALEEAVIRNYERGIIFVQYELVNTLLQLEQIDNAQKHLTDALGSARSYNDRSYIAKFQIVNAHFHTLRGDLSSAHASLLEAIDLFERMGMRRELAEAREELARLEAQMAEAAE
jgi:tetratricopeptide (TPR) repeat protein